MVENVRNCDICNCDMNYVRSYAYWLLWEVLPFMLCQTMILPYVISCSIDFYTNYDYDYILIPA